MTGYKIKHKILEALHKKYVENKNSEDIRNYVLTADDLSKTIGVDKDVIQKNCAILLNDDIIHYFDSGNPNGYTQLAKTEQYLFDKKFIKERNQKIVSVIGFILVVATFILTCITTLKDCKGKGESSTPQKQELIYSECKHNDCCCHSKKDTLKMK